MLNQWLRYVPIACLLKRAAYTTILEVGGGTRGIDKYLTGPTIVSLDISSPAPRERRRRNVFPVKGTACALPFKDGAFPAVVSLDMLEHIPPEARGAVIGELLRVARERVYLAFPVAETYGKWERLILKGYAVSGKKLPQWLCEHRQHGLPRREEVRGFLSSNAIAFEMVPNENNLVHFLAMIVDESAFSRFSTYLVDCIAPDRWERAEHTRRQNSVRAFFWPLRQVPRFLNFGSTVRVLFILRKS